jgi:hypothetical protein
MLISIQAAWSGVAWVVHKHPVHTLVEVVEVAHLCTHDVHTLLWAATDTTATAADGRHSISSSSSSGSSSALNTM